MRGPRRRRPPYRGGYPSHADARATTAELWGLAVTIGVVVVTAVVIFTMGPVIGVAVGLVLTVLAIIVVTVTSS